MKTDKQKVRIVGIGQAWDLNNAAFAILEGDAAKILASAIRRVKEAKAGGSRWTR